MDLSELNLDIRTFNAVCRAGFKTAEELFQAIGENQEHVRLLVGRNNFDRIDEAFAELEDKGMLDFTTKLPPAPAEATTPEYLEAFNLNARIHYGMELAEQGISVMCIGIEQMHSGKQYKKLGYANFEEYCQKEFEFTRKQGIKYADVGKMLQGQNGKSTSHFETLGMEKLHLLSKLDEPVRETVIETVDVESATVKELKAQITALTAERDENEHAAALLSDELDSAKESLARAQDEKEAAVDDCKNYFNGVIREKDNRIKELEDAPIMHDITDADLAEENKRLKRELEDEQLRVIMAEKSAESRARKAADEARHELTKMHETELQTLKDGYEKQLAEAERSAERSKGANEDEIIFRMLYESFEATIDGLEDFIEDFDQETITKYIKKIDEYYRKNLLYLINN